MLKEVKKLNWVTKFNSDFSKENDFINVLLKSYGVEDV